ncbi:hipl1 protein [Ancistrocladus abbreviatus]
MAPVAFRTFPFFLSCLLLCPHSFLSHPLCTDSRAPFTLKSPLKFCPYSGSVCCNATQDEQLQKLYQATNISDPDCASIVKSILCARCDQFSAELFRVTSGPRSVPVLCNSSVTANSSQPQQARDNFCSRAWDLCQNVSMLNSPFSTSLEGQGGSRVDANFTKLTVTWQSKTEFCNAFGGESADGSLCFDGEPVTLNSSGTPSSPSGLCLEKISNGSYLCMVAHPDGSNRAFFANQKGKIWLGTIPKEGSGGVIELDESSPFLDISDEVHYDSEFGLLGMAVHPKFTENGRFFVSFNCDKVKRPACSGRCSCNSDDSCDPSKLPADAGSSPCQYQSVIAEFTVNDTTSQPNLATSANPVEVRRIFTMGLPFTNHHGGQILFGPADGYLYFMMGDGGGDDDPYNFAQNKKSLLGKILRLDIDNIPSATEESTLGLWGSYSIPKDNPYTEDKELQPEIWAFGFRNPWRCSFDSKRPSYFLCADVGKDRYEEVDIITKGGNYGWRIYEGPYINTPLVSPGVNTSLNSINPIFPVMGYNHSAVNNTEGSASITGGYFYRSSTDPCMYGRYLFADLFGGAVWAGTEFPEDSGNFTTNLLSVSCASDSPMECISTPGSSLPAFGYIFSFGEDNSKDVCFLASSGVYRVVPPSRCKYTCSKEIETNVSAPTPPPSHARQLNKHLFETLIFVLTFSVLLRLYSA